MLLSSRTGRRPILPEAGNPKETDGPGKSTLAARPQSRVADEGATVEPLHPSPAAERRRVHTIGCSAMAMAGAEMADTRASRTVKAFKAFKALCFITSPFGRTLLGRIIYILHTEPVNNLLFVAVPMSGQASAAAR